MYRAITIQEKAWVYGYLNVSKDINGKTQHQILQPDNFIGLHKMHVVDPRTVEEYIRVQDDNGKDIYEGDKVQAYLKETKKIVIGEIVFNAGEFGIGDSVRGTFFSLKDCSNIVVIQSHGDSEKRVNI